MQISPSGLAMIQEFEGLILHPYRDQAGIPTIGYGTTYYPNGVKVSMGDESITPAQAVQYLTYVVNITATSMFPMISAVLNQNQWDSLISFTYNTGIGALHGSTLLKRVNANPSDPTITDAFMMWDKIHQDGQLVVLDDLVNRRKAEAKLYFTDIQ